MVGAIGASIMEPRQGDEHCRAVEDGAARRSGDRHLTAVKAYPVCQVGMVRVVAVSDIHRAVGA